MRFQIESIEAMIFTIKGHRVMLDSDLAKLYGVETKALNRQVRRNISRFPKDFLIELDLNELEDLRRQFGTANDRTHWNHKRRTTPMLFTENGVAMLSTVLNSETAIQINISIMRTFTKLRSSLKPDNSMEDRIDELETGMEETQKIFKIVFERLDSLEDQITPKLPSNRKKIGLPTNQDDQS